MSDQKNRSLLDLLQEVANLPEYMQKDAIANVVAEWRSKSTLVDEVSSGRTTFVEAIADLVEENRRLSYLNRGNACNTPQFEAMADETAARFASILPLVSFRFVPLADTVEYHLTDTVDLRQLAWRTLKFNVGMVLVVILVLFGGASFFIPELRQFWYWAVAGGVGFGLFLSVGQLLVGYPHYLSDRRALAEKTLQRARFLDKIVGSQRA